MSNILNFTNLKLTISHCSFGLQILLSLHVAFIFSKIILIVPRVLQIHKFIHIDLFINV